jgi:hypothetical protein
VERLLIAGVVALVAVAIALIVARRRPDPPAGNTDYAVPAQLDRQDFDRPDAPWLVVVFTSATCETCAGTWEKAQPLASDAVAVQEAEVGRDADLHRRYSIDAVPTLVIADAEGVVRASFLGPLTATDLWATLAELREPGSVPDGCDHGQAPS